MSAPKTIRLADLYQSPGNVELPSGRVVSVRAIDEIGMSLRESIIAGTAKDGDIWRLARHLLPDVPDTEIQSLTPHMVGAVASIACGHLEAVLALVQSLGNAPGAADQTTGPSAPANGAPTSAPE